MEKVTVKTEELLETLRVNRSVHVHEYETAFEGYREQVVSEVAHGLDIMGSGGEIFVGTRLIRPVNHVNDYDCVIRMLTMTISAGVEEIEISMSNFSQYVMDEWGWKQQFSTTNSSYS